MALAVLLVATIAMWVLHLGSSESLHGVFRWRWIALGPILALIPNIALFVLLLRSSSRKGALLWFILMVTCNIGWVIVIMMCFLADHPDQAQFWYNLSGLFWIPLPIFVFFFAISYVTDNDLAPSLWLNMVGFMAMLSLVFIAGSSDLTNVRTGERAGLYFWGYEAPAVDTQLIVIGAAFVWIALALVLLVKAYRRTIHEKRRRQLRLFIFAVAQYVVLAIALDAVLPNMFDEPPIPVMTWLYTTFLSLIIGYGILRYGIFRISPVSLSNTILQSLSEAVIGVDEKLRVEFANGGTEIIFGYSQDNLRGESIEKLFDEATFGEVRKQLSKGRRLTEFDDIAILHKSSQPVSVALSINQVFDDRNQLAGYIMVAANITELKKKTIELAREKASVEQKVRDRTRELSQLHARLTASINSLDVGFIMTGDRDQILLINPAAEEILATFAEAVDVAATDKWDIAAVERIFSPALSLRLNIGQSRRTVRSLEFKEVQLADRFMRVFMSPVTEGSKVIGTVILFEDITEEKVVARSKDEFFSIASHELRTPLTAIRGNAELIRDYYRSSITSDEVITMVGDIERSSARLVEIVNDFLVVTELEQGKVKLIPEEFDLIKVMGEVIKDQQKQHSDKKLDLRVEASVASVMMRHDKARTKQLATVFISNAFKFTDKGSVRVIIEPVKQSVKVTVTDTGKGIKPENQKLLFRKFQQAGSSLLMRDGGGTGLGLYIAKMTADQMQGSVKLESSTPGKGSSFSFTLPLTYKASKGES